MKNLLKFIPFLVIALVLKSCTAEISESFDVDGNFEPQQDSMCIDDDPITRVVNNGTTTFSLKVVRNSDGIVVVNIPNIPSNTTTSWASFSAEEYVFSIEALDGSIPDDKVLIQMDQCMAFDIEIDSNNQIVSYVPTML
jgi:hypothetical protein